MDNDTRAHMADFSSGFVGGQGAYVDGSLGGLPGSISGPRILTSDYTTSAVFYPGAMELEFDMVFVSSDFVLFYVHTSVLFAVSKHAFRAVIAQSIGSARGSVSRDILISVPEVSTVLDIILHVVYGLMVVDGPPPFEHLMGALTTMAKYDIDATMHLTTNHPHYNYLVSYAPLYPLELYTLAAQLDILPLAETASSHLLSLPLWSINDELASKIGPVYLKKLLCLHMDRREKLKEIILPTPAPHPPTKQCHFAQQRKLTRSWAVASAELAWDARVDISPNTLQTSLGIAREDITCSLCIEQLEARVKDVVTRWVRVKRTI